MRKLIYLSVVLALLVWTSVAAKAQQYEPYRVITEGRVVEPDQITPADIGRLCSVYHKAGQWLLSIHGIPSEGIHALQDDVFIDTGELYAATDNTLTLVAYWNAKRFPSAVWQVRLKDIDHIVFFDQTASATSHEKELFSTIKPGDIGLSQSRALELATFTIGCFRVQESPSILSVMNVSP